MICERKNKTPVIKKKIKEYLEGKFKCLPMLAITPFCECKFQLVNTLLTFNLADTERRYVPLLRDTNNSFQPVIGLPWSPRPLEVDFNSLGSAVVGSPIEPVMTVKAFVGPLSPSKVTASFEIIFILNNLEYWYYNLPLM